MARKLKLTPELIENVETMLSAHNSHKSTYELLCIGAETFYRWLREGEAATSGLKREFWETVKKAGAMSKALLVKQIAADPSWQAKAWILERQHPGEFGRRQAIALGDPDGKPLAPGSAGTVVVQVVCTAPQEDSPWLNPDGTAHDPTAPAQPTPETT